MPGRIWLINYYITYNEVGGDNYITDLFMIEENMLLNIAMVHNYRTYNDKLCVFNVINKKLLTTPS